MTGKRENSWVQLTFTDHQGKPSFKRQSAAVVLLVMLIVTIIVAVREPEHLQPLFESLFWFVCLSLSLGVTEFMKLKLGNNYVEAQDRDIEDTISYGDRGRDSVDDSSFPGEVKRRP